jgi:predicted metal-dependent hydrolase
MIFTNQNRGIARGQPPGEFLDAGGSRVSVMFVRNPRARRYILRLQPAGWARVTIPRGGSAAEARRFAERHTHWLKRQLDRHAAYPHRRQQWTIGTEILFRGEIVKIETGSLESSSPIQFGAHPAVVGTDALRRPLRRAQRQATERIYKADTLDQPFRPLARGRGHRSAMSLPSDRVRIGGDEIPVRDATGDLRPTIERHLWKLAAQELPPRVMEFAAAHGLTVRRITVRNQRSRWGSCSRNGTISLNWRLIQAPVFVRDYLILHELMHLRQMNHSPRFWREVERVCPDYRNAERWLNQHAALLR